MYDVCFLCICSTSVGYAIVALDAIITFFSESENYGEIDEVSILIYS